MAFQPPALLEHQEVVADFVTARPCSGVFLGVGGGKAQPLHSMVLTPRGFVPMGEVRVGTEVVVPDGSSAAVSGVFPQGIRPVYAIRLSDGRVIEADAEHIWSVTTDKTRAKGSSLQLTTLQIKERLLRASGAPQFAIESASPVDLGEWPSRIDPYLMGVLIGDGAFTCGSPRISLPDNEIRERVIALLPDAVSLKPVKGSSIDYTITQDGPYRGHENPLVTELKRFGLWLKKSGEKSLSHELLHASKASRLALLQGLLDTDGSTKNSGFEFTSKSKDLAEAVRWLTHSLAGVASLREKVIRTGPYAGNVYHRVNGRLPEGTDPFRLGRKAESRHPLQNGRRRVYDSVHTPIVSIEYARDEHTQCIMVDHPLHEYVTDGFVRTHNTNTVLASLFRMRPAGHILVVAPKNIARSTWLDEIDKWGYPLRTKSFVADEDDKLLTRKQRLERYEQVFTDQPSMYFINQELLADLVGQMPVKKIRDGRTASGRIRYRKEIQWPFTTVVVDESQGFKNPSSERFKSLARVREAVHQMILLTGTPTPNGLLDLWAQVYLLDGGKALGAKFSEYRERYFHSTMTVNDRPVGWEINGPEAEEAIFQKIKHLVMSTQNTTLPLPPITYEEYKVRMGPDMLAAYKDFAKQAVLDIVPKDSTKREAMAIIAQNAGALRTKLLQFASGTVYLDEVDEEGLPVEYGPAQSRAIKGAATPYEVLHEAKIEMLDYLIRNSGGSPVMVCYRFRSDHAQLTRRLAELGHAAKTFDGSRAMVAEWNSGSIPVMLLQPASAGHGLNLQDGGHDIVWYTLPDSLEHWIQANGRLYRLGQKHPVTVSYLTTFGTLDARQPSALAVKESLQKRLIDAVHIDSAQLLEELDVEDIIGDLGIYPL